MAQIANPRKKFNFSIAAAGLNPFLAQEVTNPDWELEVDEHGDTNYDVKTAGKVKVGMLNIKKIGTAIGPDNWVWQWISEIQNVYLGGGQLPSVYKRNFNVLQYSVDGITIINQWAYEGVWPSKINGVDLKRVESGNTIEDIDFCVDRPAHL